MTEREIFLAVLDIPDSAARAQYLDRACGGDPARRARIDSLLLSHDSAGSFLGNPAVDPLESESEATQELAGVANPEDENEADGALDFLHPSTRPDSLGRIGHYEVLQVLGKGGFGIVFRAFDETLQRVVAVKVLAAHLAATSPARKRFLREARSSAKVRHENVVQVYAVEEQPLPYLVMEFIPGETLQQRIGRTGPLETVEVVRIGQQIAEGLAAAHATGLIHRDIKPANILIEASPHPCVKITDFGLARAADDASLTQSGMVVGTPMFMAPEQALGDTLDHRADLFSLGSVLYTMCSGRPPFRANGTLAILKRVADDTPRPIREIIPEVPQWLCNIITRLHAKKPEDRIATAKEVADLLGRGMAETQPSGKVPALPEVAPAVVEKEPREGEAPAEPVRLPKPAPVPKPRSRTRRWVAAAAVLLLPVIALAVTEFAGVTHLFRQQATTGPIEPGGGPTPVLVAKQEPLPPTFENGIGMEFVIVPKGKSWLGGGKDKLGDKEVVIPADFYLGKYEVTQEEWEKVTGRNPSAFSRKGGYKDAVKDISDADLKRFPVEYVSWDQCRTFEDKLNKLERESGWEYRLPTEEEWEYACRGGPMADKTNSTFDFYFAKPTNALLPAQANFNNGLKRPCKVGSYEPNALGLYDMHGNVAEWCEGSEVRGGGCQNDASNCRAEYSTRPIDGLGNNGGLGLRLARVRLGVPPPEVKEPLAIAPFTDADVQRIAALPAAEQVEEVRKDLKRLNPKFDG